MYQSIIYFRRFEFDLYQRRYQKKLVPVRG